MTPRDPSRSPASRIPLLALPVVALAAAGVLWSNLRAVRAARPRRPGPRADAADRAARGGSDPVAYVALRTDVSNGRNLDDLVQAYGVWVSRPDAQSARRNIILALLEHRDRLAGLQALLIAVDRDPTPRSKDPLWPDLVRQVGKLWDAVTLKHGRDLVLIESRPRPKDLVLESLTEIPPERLTDDQRPQLASDLIDLYPALAPDQKPALTKALQALAGSDVVEILAGRALGEGDSRLQAARREAEGGRADPPQPREGAPGGGVSAAARASAAGTGGRERRTQAHEAHAQGGRALGELAGQLARRSPPARSGAPAAPARRGPPPPRARAIQARAST